MLIRSPGQPWHPLQPALHDERALQTLLVQSPTLLPSPGPGELAVAANFRDRFNGVGRPPRGRRRRSHRARRVRPPGRSRPAADGRRRSRRWAPACGGPPRGVRPGLRRPGGRTADRQGGGDRPGRRPGLGRERLPFQRDGEPGHRPVPAGPGRRHRQRRGPPGRGLPERRSPARPRCRGPRVALPRRRGRGAADPHGLQRATRSRGARRPTAAASDVSSWLRPPPRRPRPAGVQASVQTPSDPRFRPPPGADHRSGPKGNLRHPRRPPYLPLRPLLPHRSPPSAVPTADPAPGGAPASGTSSPFARPGGSGSGGHRHLP